MTTRLLAQLAPHFAASTGRIGLAVSGGGDSLALLDLAYQSAPTRIAAVTLDHGLRPEAAAEAQMVAQYCATRGIDHTILHWQDWDGQGNLQAEARAARYRLIGAWAQAAGLCEVWVAHNRDDVAETLLIRLGRAAGLDGLSRMASVFQRDAMTWRRPLLDTPREDLRAHLRAQGLAWAEDPSNADPRYARVRARQALDHLAPLGLGAEPLARSAAALASARALVEEVMAREWRNRIRLQGGDLLLDLSETGPELSRRLIRSGLSWIGGGGWPVRQSALEALAAHLTHAPQHNLAGCLVSRTPEGLRIAREWQAVRGLAVPLGALWDGRWEVTRAQEVAQPLGAEEQGLSSAQNAAGQDDGSSDGGSQYDGAEKGAEIRALGEGIALCPEWRASGLPRRSLMAGPAIWCGDRLLAAPLAGFDAGWRVNLRPSFATHPFAH